MSTPLRANWPEVETAFERNSPGLHSYIERASGDVVVIVDGAPEDEEKRQQVAAQPGDYVKIVPASSREQYRWMERFVASVTDKPLRDRLLIATDGKGAFRRFKDVLLGYPQERERWFNYRADLLHHHINEWFAGKDLQPDPPMPWGDVSLPPEPAAPLVRTSPHGEGPADLLRRQVKALVDVLPAGELHSARVFIEYLRDRGCAELDGTRARLDPHKPFHRRGEAVARGHVEASPASTQGDSVSEDAPEADQEAADPARKALG